MNFKKKEKGELHMMPLKIHRFEPKLNAEDIYTHTLALSFSPHSLTIVDSITKLVAVNPDYFDVVIDINSLTILNEDAAIELTWLEAEAEDARSEFVKLKKVLNDSTLHLDIVNFIDEKLNLHHKEAITIIKELEAKNKEHLKNLIDLALDTRNEKLFYQLTTV